jgi:hypothetical protein
MLTPPRFGLRLISDSGTITNYFTPTDGQGRKMSHKVAVNDYVPRAFAGEKNGISLERFE